jgi:hypothetical protein
LGKELKAAADRLKEKGEIKKLESFVRLTNKTKQMEGNGI